jgi:transposase
MSQLHALIAGYLPQEWADLAPGEAARRVKTGTGTGRGPWVQALVAAGYEVFPVNPMPVARYRERHSTSGAKSDAADAHLLAEIVRLDRAHHRPVAGDWPQAEAIKLAARAHQSLIWDRSGHVLRLRAALREFFPAALGAFPDLDAPQALELPLALAAELASLSCLSDRRGADPGPVPSANANGPGAEPGEPAYDRDQVLILGLAERARTEVPPHRGTCLRVQGADKVGGEVTTPAGAGLGPSAGSHVHLPAGQ